MKTQELISCLPIKKIHGTLPESIQHVSTDSRNVLPGTLFVCLRGYTVDGHCFVDEAIESGATVILAEEFMEVDTTKAALVIVEETARALGLLAPRFYDYPSKKIQMIGVTGTNGKTSVSGMIQALLIRLGNKSALSGTLGFHLNGVEYETANTTSDVLTNQHMIAHAVSEGCSHMVME
ncbi:MAG TPA: Mur ligase domain-containing protein, partial [Bacillaceae bacterium]